jgi:hypothetical protein
MGKNSIMSRTQQYGSTGGLIRNITEPAEVDDNIHITQQRYSQCLLKALGHFGSNSVEPLWNIIKKQYIVRIDKLFMIIHDDLSCQLTLIELEYNNEIKSYSSF